MNLHIIIGEDDFLIAETARKVIGDGTGLETIDSLNATNADLQLADIRAADDSFSTPPFLDPRKVTWWKNVHFLPGGGGKRGPAEETKAALEKFLFKLADAAPTLPENQHFILSGPHFLKTSVAAKRLAAVAEFVVFSFGKKDWEKAREAESRAVEYATERGLVFAPQAAAAFIRRVGIDTRSLLSELDKLRDYLGDARKEISTDDIAALTSPGVGVEASFWTVTDAIGERNVAKALEGLTALEKDSGFAVLMTTVIEKFFRQMLDVKNDRAEGMNPYAVRKMQGFLRNWSVNELRAARFRFLDLREKAVSGTKCADDLVVTTLVRVCRRPAKR